MAPQIDTYCILEDLDFLFRHEDNFLKSDLAINAK